MLRLSVDIDLAYLPVEDRDTSLAAIDQALGAIAADIEQHIPRTVVQASVPKKLPWKLPRKHSLPRKTPQKPPRNPKEKSTEDASL